TAVVGPNGSGKSTLVRTLVGRVPLAAGRVLIGDRQAGEMARDEIARRVAIVTQREDLAFPLSVADYVSLGRFPHLGIWHAAAEPYRQVIDNSMRAAGVETLGDRRNDALSGREWQLVHLTSELAQG